MPFPFCLIMGNLPGVQIVLRALVFFVQPLDCLFVYVLEVTFSVINLLV
jgi:hypothetical protein